MGIDEPDKKNTNKTTGRRKYHHAQEDQAWDELRNALGRWNAIILLISFAIYFPVWLFMEAYPSFFKWYEAAFNLLIIPAGCIFVHLIIVSANNIRLSI